MICLPKGAGALLPTPLRQTVVDLNAGYMAAVGRHGLFALLWVSGWGCADVAETSQVVVHSRDETGPLDGLNRRFGSLRDRMQERGFGDATVRTRVFVAAVHGTVVPLRLPTETCSTVVALSGGAIRGLSLALYDPDGAELGAAQQNREGALLHGCPRSDAEGSSHYLVVEADGGAGAVIFGVFDSQRGQAGSFAGLFDGLLAPEVPQRQVERRLLQQRARALRDREMVPVGSPLVKAAASGETVRLSVGLLGDECYAVLTASGPEVHDLDLEVFDPSGISVARNMAHDAEPTLEFCTESGGHFSVVAHVYEGFGAVGLAALLDASRSTATDKSQPEQAEVVGLSISAGAAPAPIQRHVDALLARGYGGPEFVQARGSVGAGEAKAHDLRLPTGCYLLLAAAGGGTDLDLYLLDAAGRTVDADTSIHRTARVRLCLNEGASVQAIAKGYGASGDYALAVFRAPEAVNTVAALRMEDAVAPLEARGFVRSVTTRRRYENGESFSSPFVVPAGECRAWAVTGDAAVRDVDLFLKDPEGSPLSSASGPESFAALALCAEDGEPRTVVLETRLYDGAGLLVTVELDKALRADALKDVP